MLKTITGILHRVILLVACIGPSLGVAEEVTSINVTISGYDYTVRLVENQTLTHSLKGLAGSEFDQVGQQLFRGVIEGQPNSWVRMTRAAGRWKGVVSFAGELYDVDQSEQVINPAQSRLLSSPPVDNFRAGLPLLEAQRVHMHSGATCGMAENKSLSMNTAEPLSGMVKDFSVAELSFSQLCPETIDGVCLLGEMEFVFDQQFQSLFPDNAQAQALALVNIAEGFFRQDMNIGFDTIGLRFESTSGVRLSSTTSANSLLTDFESKRSSFTSSSATFAHLVTGRNLAGSTVGIAYLGSACSSQALGVTEVLSSSSATAIVMAHEIAHNLGAVHDTDNACPTGFIMSPFLSGSPSGFSSCSIQEVKDALGFLRTPTACFNFAADVTIAAENDNTTESATGESETLDYQLQTRETFADVTAITVTGNITSGGGRFTDAALGNQVCSVSGDGQSYGCTLNSPGAIELLSAGITPLAEGRLAISHQLNISGTNEAVDINQQNNRVTSQLNIAPGEVIQAPDIASDSVPAPAPSSGGGGGGGSLGLLTLVLMMLFCLFGRRPFAPPLTLNP